MTEDEARMVQKFARLQGLAGEAAPVSPAAPAGEWRLYRDGTDVTADVVRTLKDGPRPPASAPARGFVIPR